MKRLATSLAVAVFVLSSLAPPSASAARPVAEKVTVQRVALQHVNDGLGPKVMPGDVGINNYVTGNCGWASFYVTSNGGGGHARLEAAAGTSHVFPIVFADYRIDWRNNIAGTSGSITGQTFQYSWTWASDHPRYTSTGWVYGKLAKLFVRHQDGHACVGLTPSDTTWIP